MANILDIPANTQQSKDAGKFLIRTVGGSAIKTAIYKGNMPQGTAYEQPDLKKGELNINNNYTAPDEGLSKSKLLGTTVLCNLVIYAQNWIDNQTGNTITSFNQDIVLDSVLVSVGMQKHIVETAVQGRNGTVKEYISDGDYAIDIKGTLTAPNGQSVRSLMNPLIEACKAQIALRIDSWYLTELFGITNIVVYYYNFPQSAGGYSTQNFEIQCKSDKPIELILKDVANNL